MKIKARVIGCTVLGGEHTCALGLLWSDFGWQDFSADDNHEGQNNRQLKLHTLINFVWRRYLVLIPITI